MSDHFIQATYVRDDALPEPTAYVADVVCACARIFTSDLQASEDAARDDVLAQHAVHVDEESRPAKPHRGSA